MELAIRSTPTAPQWPRSMGIAGEIAGGWSHLEVSSSPPRTSLGFTCCRQNGLLSRVGGQRFRGLDGSLDGDEGLEGLLGVGHLT
mmetsp:Transcript_23432/g.35370  ORF Transcript_23432/g.35370 Transcript_23432/m.35370 type:complete len:85 (+) Transcript_23432:111-365(+)